MKITLVTQTGIFLAGILAALPAIAADAAPITIKTGAEIRAQWAQQPPAELRKLAEAGNGEAAYVYGLQEMEQGRAAVNAAFQHSLAAEPTGPVFKREDVFARWEKVPREDLLKAVASTNREAQYYWSQIGQAEGVARTRQGFTWLQQAAEQGVAPAQFEVGRFYAQKMRYVVVDRDSQAAAKWFQKAADRGHEESNHQLAELYWEGELGRPDLAQTVQLLQRCVDLGCHRAEYQLALLYASGTGEPRHEGEKPTALLEKARAGGVPLAFLELAQRYRIGFGVPKNLVRAARYYVLITQFDNIDWKLRSRVEEIFGLLTPDGKPKPNPDSETAQFAGYLAVQARAIQERDPTAILQMVEWESANADDERTRIFAYFWLSRAQRSGAAAASTARDRLEKIMSATELEQAKTAVAQDLKHEAEQRK
jgi:TPR repeat protein